MAILRRVPWLINSMDFEQLLDRGIAVMMPTYVDGAGDVLEIVTADGVMARFNHTLRWALKAAARYYGTDLDAVRHRYSNMLSRRYNLPIPLAVDTVLMPVKVRKPIVSKDGAAGYVNVMQLDDIYSDEGLVFIRFRNGWRLSVLQTVNTLHSRIKDANMVREDFLRCYIERRQTHDLWYEVRGEYDMPATKGDIAIIADRLLMLMERLGS